MALWVSKQLEWQLNAARKNGLYIMLRDAAEFYSLPLSFVLAVASRETGIRNIAGDGGHGKGVIQIDDRFHAIARERDFRKEPAAFISYGVKMLKENAQWAKERWPHYNMLKIAASAYNAGPGGAVYGVVRGDSDLRTKGRDYGRDVMARAVVFERLVQAIEKDNA